MLRLRAAKIRKLFCEAEFLVEDAATAYSWNGVYPKKLTEAQQEQYLGRALVKAEKACQMIEEELLRIAAE